MRAPLGQHGKVECSGKLKKRAKKVTLKSRKLKAGKYTLKISIATVGRAAASQSVSIKI